ncbi:MAG: aminoacetone oxidase family FAD-binding enzyme [Spirochaetales bacterium]|nr:aminoacetone oxidase family FAD-binding enzyme [Spirochaetales bacterium]
MRIAIIGGGPAGLMAAACLGGAAGVFERGGRPGRKLLLSGGGQCNITHSGGVGDFLPCYGGNGRFLKAALYAFPPEALLGFFRGRGLDFIVREDGKIFPKTLNSASVLEALLKAVRAADFHTSTKVTALRGVSGGFAIETAKETELEKKPLAEKKVYRADKVILAAGGRSCPHTGSDGSGFALAQSLGHTIRWPKPALCGILSPGFESLAGNSFRHTGVAVFRSENGGGGAGRLVLRGEGDLLFTHRGVSGPVILNLSRYIERGDTLAVNFLHPRNPEGFLQAFSAVVKKEPRKTAGTLLAAYSLTRALEDFILARASIPRSKTCATLTRAETRELARQLVRFPAPVAATEDFHSAMTTAGGVSLDEVNPKTMESRIVPGLYFAGEILDIDGDEGGYNLQAAFSTGYLAAQSLAL